MKIQVAWRRRPSPNGPPTTDVNGYYPYEFNFVDGKRIIDLVRRQGSNQACVYQKELFKSPCYLTNVEVWLSKDGENCYIYAEPATDIINALTAPPPTATE